MHHERYSTNFYRKFAGNRRKASKTAKQNFTSSDLSSSFEKSDRLLGLRFGSRIASRLRLDRKDSGNVMRESRSMQRTRLLQGNNST